MRGFFRRRKAFDRRSHVKEECEEVTAPEITVMTPAHTALWTDVFIATLAWPQDLPLLGAARPVQLAVNQ
jgi:hypothetical protein